MTDGELTELPFSQVYSKFQGSVVFTTIRRRDKYGDAGDRVQVTVNGDDYGVAEIVGKEELAMEEMPQSLLFYDTRPHAKELWSIDSAVDLLRSFYQDPPAMDEPLTVYFLCKVEGWTV
jgi:hypothetical protein